MHHVLGEQGGQAQGLGKRLIDRYAWACQTLLGDNPLLVIFKIMISKSSQPKNLKQARPFFEDGKWRLVLDNDHDRLVLSDVGAEDLKIALCNLPIYKDPGLFWGYNYPKNQTLCNCELPKAGDVVVILSSDDNKALEVVADHMNDSRCWKPE